MNNIVTKARLEKLKRLRLFDDDYANIVFKDKECVKYILSTILKEEIQFYHHETERKMKVVSGRTIECDIFVLSKDKAINVEIEKHSFRLKPQRIRYHASVLDCHVSKQSQNFDEMLDIVVIFICEFDPVGKGCPMYHINRQIQESKDIFHDDMQIILVNGSYSADDEIGRLIHDLKCTNSSEMYSEVLKEKTKYYKEDEKGARIMCEAWEEERRKGKAEGRAEGRTEGKAEGKTETLISSLKSLMETMNLGIEEAMNALRLNDEEKQMCRKELKL